MKKFLVLLLCLAMCACLFACGDSEETTAAITEEVVTTTEAVVTTTEAVVTTEIAYSTPEDAVALIDTFLGTMKNGTVEDYAALTGMSLDDDDPMTKTMVEAMFKKFDYTLGALTEVDDTHATVDASITSLNIMAALTAYMSLAGQVEDAETWDEDGAIFLDLLTADAAATSTTDVKINLEKVDGVWTISEDNSDFIAALTGGLM